MNSDGSFDTSVAELGVGCEACHGPGAEHVESNTDPIRRQALHSSDRADPTIVNPARLPHERQSDVCGRCHGQRKTDAIEEVLQKGDLFIPGESLSLYSEPLWRDTSLGAQPTPFAARFWSDGTARLTAYEYQGWLQSACATRGELSCATCHGMHDAPPAGQIRAEARDDRSCHGCHTDLAANHTRHESAIACVDCHMPPIVYGLVRIHRSHRIDLPRRTFDASDDRPDACVLCHLERDGSWAARSTTALWSEAKPTNPTVEASPSSWGRSWVVQTLFGGDPIQRSVAAAALGRADAIVEDDLAMAALLEAMLSDPYPAVREIAARSAEALAKELNARRSTGSAVDTDWEAFRSTDGRQTRELFVEQVRRAFGAAIAAPLAGDLLHELRAHSADVAIRIGE